MKSSQNKVLAALALAWQVGFLIVLPMGILLLGGLWLDAKLNSAPLFVLAGMVTGTVLGAVLLTRRVMRILQDNDDL
ncbi:MAG: AtpZ/AtpI family protein [Candidatus Yanofskybacteria bacterium]|nr:AtpZ/AtpI family protein [Candidatus Yanofskybacteria bacterium]